MRSTLLAVFGVMGWATFSPLASATTPPVARIWLPEAHVVCDRAQQACFDAYGLSLGYTQVYFGVEAETALLESLNQGRLPNAVVEMEPGVSCSLTEQICFDDDGVSVGLTQIYLGQEVADRLTAQVTRRIYMPNANVACDLDQSICFDDFGYSLGYTQVYLGRAAVSAWLEQLNGGEEPASSFSPTADVTCYLQLKTCTDAQGPSIGITEEWFGVAAATALTAQLSGGSAAGVDLEGACREALAAQYQVSPETIELQFGRSDEGGSAYAFSLSNGRVGTCRVMNDGTIDYIQGN